MREGQVRALIDTNVWVSALINANGPPAKVLDAFRSGRFVAVVSQALLDEISDVLRRPRIRRLCPLSEDDLVTFLTLLSEQAIEVHPTGDVQLCRDTEDDIILETAILGEASILVSRDDDLKRDLDLVAELRERGIETLSVAQFLRLLAA